MSGLTLIGGSALDFTAAGSLIQEKGKELLTKFLVFKLLVLLLGMRLHGQMRDRGMIKDRSKHLRSHQKSFIGRFVMCVYVGVQFEEFS